MKKTVLLMIIAGMTCLFFCGCSSSGNTAAQRLIDNWPAGVVEAVNAVSDRCIESSDGNGSAVYFWKTDEYLLSPAPEKLLKTDQDTSGDKKKKAADIYLDEALAVINDYISWCIKAKGL